MKALRIAKWDDVYETAESRRTARLSWVAVPNGHDSLGFCTLMAHPNGMAHIGAWNLILQVASKMPVRGLLVTGKGVPHTAETLGMITRGSGKIFAEAIPRLLEAGWLEEVEHEPAAESDHQGKPLAERPGPGNGEPSTRPRSAQRTPGACPGRAQGVPALQDSTVQDRTEVENAGAPATTPAADPMTKALTEVEDAGRRTVVPETPPMGRTWMDWRRDHPRLFIARTGEDGDMSAWSAAWRDLGDDAWAAFDAGYAVLVERLPNPKWKVRFAEFAEWLKENTVDA